MKKILLGSASALAFLALGSVANAQALDVDVELDIGSIVGIGDTDLETRELYVNAALNANNVDGSVNIDADGLLGVTGLGSVDLRAQGSLAAAVAIGDIDVDADILGGGLADVTVGVDGVVLAAAGGAQLDVDLVGNRISSTGILETTAIGAVNEGTIGIGADTFSLFDDDSSTDGFGGVFISDQQFAASASNTSNTAAAAIAAQSDVFAIGPSVDIDTDVFRISSSEPIDDVLALNVAYQAGFVDGSVNLDGAAFNDIAGTATTAIGAVNTGTITSGLPGSITIVVGGDTGDDG